MAVSFVNQGLYNHVFLTCCCDDRGVQGDVKIHFSITGGSETYLINIKQQHENDSLKRCQFIYKNMLKMSQIVVSIDDLLELDVAYVYNGTHYPVTFSCPNHLTAYSFCTLTLFVQRENQVSAQLTESS